MSQGKWRGQFEAWANTEGYSTKTDNVGYCHPETNMAWRAWQASRAAVVVELPEGYACQTGEYQTDLVVERSAVVEAIEAAGVKVAP